MKVILNQDVKSLGKKGDIVEVSDGYARNFILAKKLGVEANSSNLNDLKLKKANDEKIAQQQLEDAREYAKVIESKKVVLKIKQGESGKTFGSISSKEIAAAAKDQHDMELDKKKIVLKDPIKSVGTFQVPIKLHPKVTASLQVSVEEE
ncbi:MAG: 50S ribosomal protein L9 [Lachnospiraceae bacterium]|nr:50S ribosomal protein L9 [Lachnospiraceae bacterium]